MSNPTFSLLHPTIRPQAWEAACKRWYETCDYPGGVEYILVPEAAKFNYLPMLEDIWGQTDIRANSRTATLVGGFNCAAARSTGQVLIVMADDVTPPQHWDSTILNLLGDRINTEAVLWASSGLPDLDVGTIMHPVLTRQYYNKFGYLFWPEYEHVYADSEFSDIAFENGVVIDARDKLRITHERIGHDETYQLHDNSGVETRKFYLKRKSERLGHD